MRERVSSILRDFFFSLFWCEIKMKKRTLQKLITNAPEIASETIVCNKRSRIGFSFVYGKDRFDYRLIFQKTHAKSMKEFPPGSSSYWDCKVSDKLSC
jgi:hypothetical protein